jgi:hypothetical protein
MNLTKKDKDNARLCKRKPFLQMQFVKKKKLSFRSEGNKTSIDFPKNKNTKRNLLQLPSSANKRILK